MKIPALRLPAKPEEVSDDQIPVVLDRKDCLRGYLKVHLLDAFNHLQGKLRWGEFAGRLRGRVEFVCQCVNVEHSLRKLLPQT